MKKKRTKIPPHISKLIDQFVDCFEVKSWDKTVDFPLQDHDHIAADIEVDERYQRLYINFYPCFFKNTRERQYSYLLHEFCHIITQPMLNLLDKFKAGELVTPQQIKDESERATSRIASMLEGSFLNLHRPERKAYAAYLKLPKSKRTKVAKSKAK